MQVFLQMEFFLKKTYHPKCQKCKSIKLWQKSFEGFFSFCILLESLEKNTPCFWLHQGIILWKPNFSHFMIWYCIFFEKQILFASLSPLYLDYQIKINNFWYKCSACSWNWGQFEKVFMWASEYQIFRMGPSMNHLRIPPSTAHPDGFELRFKTSLRPTFFSFECPHKTCYLLTAAILVKNLTRFRAHNRLNIWNNDDLF